MAALWYGEVVGNPVFWGANVWAPRNNDFQLRASPIDSPKCREISVREELSKVACSFNDIREVQAVMPHTRAAPLPTRKLGSVVSVRSSKPDPLSARGDATAPTSSRHNPPDRSPRPGGTQQANRYRCQAASHRVRLTQRTRARGRSRAGRDPPTWPRRPVYRRSGARGSWSSPSLCPTRWARWTPNSGRPSVVL